MKEWKDAPDQFEPIPTPCEPDWREMSKHHEDKALRFEHQCMFYEEEIKRLHDQVDALKTVIKNIVTHM